MTSNVKNECLINGVRYKCRCCFDPGRKVYSLTDEASSSKTWGDLLKDIAQLQAKDDDLLPKTVCGKCSDKLKTSYDFILQIQNVNKKYSQLLGNDNTDPLHEGVLNEIDNFSDCLAESAIVLPLEEYKPEVKLEEALFTSYDTVLSNKDQSPEDIDAKSENEDNDDPFTENYNEDLKEISEELEKNESEKNTTKPNKRKRFKQSEEGESLFKNRKKRIRKTKPPKATGGTSDTDKVKNNADDDFNITAGNAKDPITCGKCSQTFMTMYTYQKHQNAEHPTDREDQERNTCPICAKVFTTKFYVTDHIKIVHDKIRPFKCAHCSKSFPSLYKKQAHELSHTDIFPFQCEYCEKRFRVSSKLKLHTEIHTTKPELLCPICKRGQKSAKELEEHVKNHDDNRLQCPSCGNLYRRRSQLNDHYNAVHLKLRPYKCGFCELGFGDRKTRRMHERKHHPCNDSSVNLLKLSSLYQTHETV